MNLTNHVYEFIMQKNFYPEPSNEVSEANLNAKKRIWNNQPFTKSLEIRRGVFFNVDSSHIHLLAQNLAFSEQRS